MNMDTVDFVWCAVSNDGYLYGATECPEGEDRNFWNEYYSDIEPDDWSVLCLHNVPEDLCKKLFAQGTNLQVYADGYEAWNAASPYLPEE